MTIVGYARVSTPQQSLDQQYDALREKGCERIFEDVKSGARNDREGLKALLDYVRPGDTVVVWRLDRLGRSLSHMVRTAEELHAKGVKILGTNDGVDYSTPTGQMIAHILAALAQYERWLINERAAVAREAARARGKPIGRKRAMSLTQIDQARELRKAGTSINDICIELGVKRATLYRALNGASQ